MAIKEHQVVKGETVSGIAQKFGVPVSSVSGFKSGDPNQIGIGETLNINIPDVQAQTMEIQRGVKDDPTAMPSFEVDVPDTFDTDTVTKITKEPTTAEDLTAKIRASEEARAQIQADIEAASELTPEEEALRRQVVDLKAAGRTAEERALQSGETLRFAAGEAQRVRREANLSILAASERLQALTGIRESRFEKLKTKLGFEDTRFERLLGLEQEFKAMKKEEKEEMRDNLSVILDFSAGLTFEELDPESQQQIADSAESIGIPLESIKNALRNNAIAQREKEEKSSQFFSDIATTTTKDLKTQMKEKFGTAFANKVILGLNDEQLREFMRDFEITQNELGQSLDPEIFLKEWKAEVGIETGSKKETQLSDEEFLKFLKGE